MFLVFQGHTVLYHAINAIEPLTKEIQNIDEHRVYFDPRLYYKIHLDSGAFLEFVIRDQDDQNVMDAFIADFHKWLKDQEDGIKRVEYAHASEIGSFEGFEDWLRRTRDGSDLKFPHWDGVLSTDHGFSHFIDTEIKKQQQKVSTTPKDDVHRKNREKMDEIARNTPGYTPYNSDKEKEIDWDAIKSSEL